MSRVAATRFFRWQIRPFSTSPKIGTGWQKGVTQRCFGSTSSEIERIRMFSATSVVLQNINPVLFSSRWFSSSSSDSLCPKQIQVRLNEFQELFVEARMCIDDVKDSVGTVYYEDDADDARDAVDAAIQHFEALVAEITDIDEKNKVLRSNGLKVEQLKGELELTLNGGHDHH